jgi:hypothetical protein
MRLLSRSRHMGRGKTFGRIIAVIGLRLRKGLENHAPPAPGVAQIKLEQTTKIKAANVARQLDIGDKAAEVMNAKLDAARVKALKENVARDWDLMVLRGEDSRRDRV